MGSHYQLSLIVYVLLSTGDNAEITICTCTGTRGNLPSGQVLPRVVLTSANTSQQRKIAETYPVSTGRLNERQRRNAVQMLLNGRSQSEVARVLNVHRSTVSRLYQRLGQTGTTDDRPRPGRPRVTSRRQDRFMRPSEASPQSVFNRH